MSDPLVTCVLLTADRPAMTARAVQCFLSQTYERKALVIFDTGRQKYPSVTEYGPANVFPLGYSETIYTRAEQFRGASIGALRNAANELCRGTDIIAHWDSDDWSHPYRLAEQVNLLQASLAEAVGYNDMLMWCSQVRNGPEIEVTGGGLFGHPASTCREFIPGLKELAYEAWLYNYDGHGVPQQAHGRRPKSAYALETSLLYWRRSWEKLKFGDNNLGDVRWMKTVLCVSETSLPKEGEPFVQFPRMIAEIHGANTVMRPDLLRGHEFKRVPEWDAFCRERMKL